MIKFLNKYCSYLRRFLRAQIKALTLLVDKTNSLCRFSFTITVLLRQCVYRMYPNSGGAAPPQPHDDYDTIKTVQGSCWTKCSSTTIHHNNKNFYNLESLIMIIHAKANLYALHPPLCIDAPSPDMPPSRRSLLSSKQMHTDLHYTQSTIILFYSSFVRERNGHKSHHSVTCPPHRCRHHLHLCHMYACTRLPWMWLVLVCV